MSLRVGGPHYYTLRSDSDVGGEVYERMLLEHLPAHGIELVLGLPRDHCADPPPAGWEVDVLGHELGLHWVRAPLVFTPYAVGLLRDRKVALLRGHSVRHTGPALLMARALTRVRVPVVLHHHHLDPRWGWLEAAIARRADAVITVSELSRRALVAAGVPSGLVHVVHEGVGRPPASGGWLDAWPSDAGLRLLSLGRLEERKRPWVAIDALAALGRLGVGASLVIAGQGPLEPQLRARAAQAGVASAVRFVGRVGDGEKWRLYDAAHVLLFASTLEGFGLVVAEAQSRGLPAIVAAGTASAEALEPGGSGLLAAPNGEAFAARTAELADEDVRRRMAEHARRFAARFDWDACALGVAEIYRGLAEPRGKAMADLRA